MISTQDRFRAWFVLYAAMFWFVLTQFWLCFLFVFLLRQRRPFNIPSLYIWDPIATRGAACSLPSVQACRTPMGWGGIQPCYLNGCPKRVIDLFAAALCYRWTWVIWPDNCQQTMMYTHVVQEILVFFHDFRWNASRVMNLLPTKKQLLAFGCWPAAGCV